MTTNISLGLIKGLEKCVYKDVWSVGWSVACLVTFTSVAK